MNKKTWSEKLAGLKKLRDASIFNKKREEDNIEELDFMISHYKAKIKTFK